MTVSNLYLDEKYSIFASGQICYHKPGASSISIKLAEGIFNKSLELLNLNRKQLTIYDPCCGCAYHFVALGYLYWKSIERIICSDSDTAILDIARNNLSLLTISGLGRRINELERMIGKFKKKSHFINHRNALKLKTILEENVLDHKIEKMVFEHNIVQDKLNRYNFKHNVDLVFTDIPYGNLSQWEGNGDLDENSCVTHLLSNIEEIICKNGLITMVATKNIKINHPLYKVVKKMKIGKRRIFFIIKT